MNFLLGHVFKLVGKLLAGLGIYVAGHRAGSQKAVIKSQKKAAKKRRQADEIDDEVRRASIGDVRERLRRDTDPD